MLSILELASFRQKNKPLTFNHKKTTVYNPPPCFSSIYEATSPLFLKKEKQTFQISKSLVNINKNSDHLNKKSNMNPPQLQKKLFLNDLAAILTGKPIFNKMTQFYTLYAAVKNSQLEKLEDIEVTYQSICLTFRKIEHNNSMSAWVQKADLLDAIDLLIEMYPQAKLQPISIIPPTSPPLWAEGAIPIIPYFELEKATELMAKADGKVDTVAGQIFRSKQKLQECLLGIVQPEYSGRSGEVIRALTKQKLAPLAPIFGVLYRIMTRLIGCFYNRPALIGSNIKKIAKASLGMGIQSIEILSKKLCDETGEVFFYRGPRYLFNPNKSIHDYKTIDEWFSRDLTKQAKKDYLTKVHSLEKKLSIQYGEAQKKANRLVISNSDSRVRVKKIKDLTEDEDIVHGKVFSQQAEKEAKAKGDNPIYYTKNYLFNAKNLLGLTKTDDLKPHQQNLNQIQAFFQDSSCLSETASLQERRFLLKKHEPLILSAQQELLAGIARLFQKERVIRVIQRLAPADIHNYVAPLKGKPLSMEEAVEEIEKRLSQEDESKQEYAVLQQLKQIFNCQKNTLGRAMQCTIDIYGGLQGNHSVQTHAIANKPSILSQNDRKIMLFLHEDGNLSLHAFVGATGVNRVNVNPDSIHMEQGDQKGDMRPGEDNYKAEKTFFAATSKTTRDGIKKLTLGERQGSFDMRGSTVISYYIQNDFTPLPMIEAYQKEAIYQDPVNQKRGKEVEIQCKMGDPLLIKTEVAMAQYLESELELFQTYLNSKEVFESFLQRTEEPKAKDKKLNTHLKTILTKKNLTYSEKMLKINLAHLIDHRLKILLQKEDKSKENNGDHLSDCYQN